jgi:hypothetical protein
MYDVFFLSNSDSPIAILRKCDGMKRSNHYGVEARLRVNLDWVKISN